MEAILRETVNDDAPDKYSIRAVECRSTICVMETASVFGTYSGPQYGSRLDKVLAADVGKYGYETNQDGARVTITVMPFTRR
jgi:hypothetical protein